MECQKKKSVNTGLNTKRQLVRTKRARKNLAFKLMLQERFEPELKRYFDEIARKFANRYRNVGDILPREFYHENTVDILEKQYTRVSKAFSDEMRSSRDEKSMNDIERKQNEDEELDELINEALFIFVNVSANQRSLFLDDTTEKNMEQAVSKARMQLEEEGEQITNTAVAALAFINLNQLFGGRIETIALTETQYSAERTKAIEANAVAGGPDANISNVVQVEGIEDFETKKLWSSVLAQNTRDTHASADGQRQQLSDPFIVGGELLKHPGDSSLGASIGNTANCQCSALYS